MSEKNKMPDGYYVLIKKDKESLVNMVLELRRQIIDLEKDKKNAVTEVSRITKQLHAKNSELAIVGQEDMIKKILEYKAIKLAPAQICTKLEMQGYDTTTEVIEKILESEWTLEMKAYFKQCEENYLETVSINPALFRVTNLTKLQAMNDEYEKMLRDGSIEDTKTKLQVMSDMQNNIKKMEDIVRNVQEERIQTGEDQEDMATKEADNWQETVGSFMNFEGHEGDFIDIEEV
ncbi:MAG: hypothetical protein ACRCRT_00175 [Cetobacterium somerae]